MLSVVVVVKKVVHEHLHLNLVFLGEGRERLFLEPAREAIDLVESGEGSGWLVAAVGAICFTLCKRDRSAYPGSLRQKVDLLGVGVSYENTIALPACF